MRLIDADELKKALNANCENLCPDKDTHWCEHCCPHNEVEDLIDNAPTVERPQGGWNYGEDEQGQDGWFCSECGFFVPWYYQYYEKDVDFIREYKACPHCFAEMITYTGKDRDKKGGAE